MSQRNCGTPREVRSNALWGSGNRGGDHRSNALWGKGGRGLATIMTVALSALAVPLVAVAGSAAINGGSNYVAPGVLQSAKNNPTGKVEVIIQSSGGVEGAKNALSGLGLGSARKELRLIGAVAADVPANKVDDLKSIPGLTVTLDALMKLDDYSSTELWVYQNGSAKLWPTKLNPGPKLPTIAIVDSGIDKKQQSFGDGKRVLQRQVFASLPQDGSKLDGRGHGTFVAGLAAGEATGYAGVAPSAPLIDLDVMDDQGQARTSDVVAACEWILKNKDAYNIRVVNLSLHSSAVLSIRYHPLNKAVEKLWFAGVTVVAAAGNYGVAGGPSGVHHAPGNDPFVITVGAYDPGGTARLNDDEVPSWSAYGYTNEGFAKPDVVAAGRYLVGPVSTGATLATDRPDRIVAPGYMRLSGTSFATPIVSGIAADILARHPEYGPDQVKGALMMTARRLLEAERLQQGRGEVNAVRAATLSRTPANPNLALRRFVVPDPAGSGAPVFSASAWYDAMRTDSAWDSSAWTDSGWADSGWADSAWTDSAWLDSAWLDSAWTDSAWADATTYEDNVAGEPDGATQLLDATDAAEIESDPALALPSTTSSSGLLP